MGFFSNLWHGILRYAFDHRGKLTATGGFIIGVVLTLGFKDFYPDLERSYRQRLLKIRGRSAQKVIPGETGFVQLEDHTQRRSSINLSNDLQKTSSQPRGSGLVAGVEGLIGNTPLIKLQALSDALGCEILAKAEYLNGAGNSPKDRVALSIIQLAEDEGILVPHRGDTIYEGTVGSTGISLAAVCRARGYKAYICMPDDQAREKSDLLLKLGATVERVRPASIVDQSQFVNLARRRAEQHTNDPDKPGIGFFADQFENTANYMAHQNTTGPEIYKQTDGQLDAFVAGAGTGGTISGVALALKPLIPELKVILADPQGSGLFNKIKYGVMFSPTEAEGTRRRHQVDTIVEGIGINRLTANMLAGLELIDDAVKVSDAQAKRMARWLVEKEGIFVGSSSAVNLVAAAKTAETLPKGSTIVTILCDSGTRHLSKFWKEVGDIGGTDEDVDLDEILSMK